jgi:tripeptide aminopeptidase
MIHSDALLRRFLKYVEIETTSNETSDTFPSSDGQWDLLRLLRYQLEEFGLQDVNVDSYGYVTATLPSNTNLQAPVIAFLAHVDTSPDMSGRNIKPLVTENYDGADIIINPEQHIVLSPAMFPELLDYKGQTIISTDGTTLLGADDKAGVAEIMAAVEYLIQHPEIKHGTIKIAFTPDEEIGRGVDYFDVKSFAADYAFTVDGGAIGELEYENFNAAAAKITIQGQNIHPGYAKGKMKNALLLGIEFNALLPENERPENTEGYQGFYHLMKTDGSVENAHLQYIIRDHDRGLFENRKQFMQQCASTMNEKYGAGTVVVELKDQYYNMRECIEPCMHLVETAKQAMLSLGITPRLVPVRGGTDGARLSYMGLPCPNIFAGGHNFHGRFEYVPLQSMVKAAEVIIKIAELYAQP